MELADQFASSKHHIHPKTTQSMPSCQIRVHRLDDVLLQEYELQYLHPSHQESPKIPDTVAIGIQFRSIANKNGKKPAFDKENPPAAAIHLDMDERYALVYQARCASLWRKNLKQRLPNGVQLRLVPCFTSATGKSMTDKERSGAKTLLEHQFYFVKEHLGTLPPYFFISQLDTPFSEDNPMTLRRPMMSRAPSKSATSRLIHNVDAFWNQPSKHIITTVVGSDVKAQRFPAKMIPVLLHRFGDVASKWFTGSGLLLYKDVKWNPDKGTTSLAKERDSEEMVKEDLWDLTSKWEQINKNKASTRPGEATIDATTTPLAAMPATGINAEAPTIDLTEKTERLASDKSIASFQNIYNRPID
jgi:hypothetical protein